MIIYSLTYAGLLPLIASASIAFIMRRMRSPSPIVWPVAIAGGFLSGQFALRGQSGLVDNLHTFLQPHEAVDWLPHIVLLALGVNVVIYFAPTHRPRLIALATALCLAAPVRLLSGNLAQHWSLLEKLAILPSLAAVFGIVWLLLASNDDVQPARFRVPLLILATIATGVVLTHSGVLTYGLACGAVAASITGAALAGSGATGSANAWQWLGGQGIHGAAGVITFTLGSLIILGHFYAELTTTNAALLFLSLTATAAPLPALLKTGPTWPRSTARAIACLLPSAIAVYGL